MSEDDDHSDKENYLPVSLKDTYVVGFKSVHTKGDIPCSRTGFALTQFTKTCVFLSGGCNDEQDFNDAYILDLVSMKWTRVDIGLKLPLVGHASACLYRSLSKYRPYIYIFGGWDGSSYSDKGILINPQTLEVLISNYNDSVMDWSTISKGSYTFSGGSNSSIAPLATRNGNIRFDSGNSTKKINTASLIPSPKPSNSKSISWFASVRSEKAKTENNVKKIFSEKVPFSRRDHTLTFDSESQKLYLYGGWNALHWGYDESKFLEVWSLDSNWRWTKENIKGDIPPGRRGHTAVFLSKKSIIIYGGCSGFNKILDDCYEYDIDECSFTRIAARDMTHWPKGRAWHSAQLIGDIIYYYGGLTADFKVTKEVIGFDTYQYKWKFVECVYQEGISGMERFGHSSFSIDQSIVILGGSTRINGSDDKDSERHHDKKIHFSDLLIIETDENEFFQKAVSEAAKMDIVFERKEKKEVNIEKNIKPPPIPAHLRDPARLAEDQSNFLHWNPHIFPNEANKAKIQHFKKKIEEETINRSALVQYPEFEGLGDEESFSVSSSKQHDNNKIVIGSNHEQSNTI